MADDNVVAPYVRCQTPFQYAVHDATRSMAILNISGFVPRMEREGPRTSMWTECTRCHHPVSDGDICRHCFGERHPCSPLEKS